LELFSTCLELSRYILRDSLAIARSMQRIKHLRGEEKKASIPNHIESLRPYCFFFTSVLAISHIATVLHSRDNLVYFPGFLEINIVIMLTNIKEKKESRQNTPSKTSRSIKQKKEEISSNYDIYKCISNAQKLSVFVAHITFGQYFLEQVLVTRNKMIKHLVHPSIKYIQYRVSNFRSVLGIQQQSTAAIPASENPRSLLNAQKLIPQHEGFYIFNEIEVLLTLTDPPDEFDTEFGTNLSRIPASDIAIQQKQSNCWSLRKSFRPMFILFESIHRPNRFTVAFDEKYLPQYNPLETPDLAISEDLKKLNQTGITKFLEGYYFHYCSDGLISRQLDPMQDVFWICQYIIEYLFKMGKDLYPH